MNKYLLFIKTIEFIDCEPAWYKNQKYKVIDEDDQFYEVDSEYNGLDYIKCKIDKTLESEAFKVIEE